MRITNKIMQKNNLANINTNKIYQDKLSTQMSTQKKISRPSEDPVVAIRALRLRSNVTEITQYYSKNIPDAESWLNVTEDALKNLTEIVTNMISQCTKGSNGDLTSSDREVILEQLKALGDEVYTTGDVDYAGRYVFTGYRTDTSLSFLKEETTKYDIIEQLDNNAIDKLTNVNTGDLLQINGSNYDNTMSGITEQDVYSVDVYRIRLAYNDCLEGALPSISVNQKNATTGEYEMKPLWNHENDTSAEATGDKIIETWHTYDQPHGYNDPYTYVAENADAVVYIPETGELLMGDNRYNELMAIKDDITTVENEGEIRVGYSKETWKTGELRPEHYFWCKKTDAQSGEEIEYNPSYLTGDTERQDIEYDVGFNQTIRVNSTADECFKHGIGRTVDDLVAAIENVKDLEKVQIELKNWQEDATEAENEIIEKQLDAVGKALTLAKDKLQRSFEAGITTFQGYLDEANLCITECGTRSSKLELIENRMMNQKTTFETLKSENEDADITEVAIQLNSAALTYEASLMATGKLMQTSLLNFI